MYCNHPGEMESHCGACGSILMAHCPACQTEYRIIDTRYCRKCGHKLEDHKRIQGVGRQAV